MDGNIKVDEDEEAVFGFVWHRIGPEGGYNRHCH
jgi:hypothetical protein